MVDTSPGWLFKFYVIKWSENFSSLLAWAAFLLLHSYMWLVASVMDLVGDGYDMPCRKFSRAIRVYSDGMNWWQCLKILGLKDSLHLMNPISSFYIWRHQDPDRQSNCRIFIVSWFWMCWYPMMDWSLSSVPHLYWIRLHLVLL